MGVFHRPIPGAHPKEGRQYLMIFLNLRLFYDTYEEAAHAYQSTWQIYLAAARYRARVKGAVA